MTGEDLDIWECLMERLGVSTGLKIRQSDLSDAELMRTAQQHKGCVAHWSASRGHAALVRGWK